MTIESNKTPRKPSSDSELSKARTNGAPPGTCYFYDGSLWHGFSVSRSGRLQPVLAHRDENLCIAGLWSWKTTAGPIGLVLTGTSPDECFYEKSEDADEDADGLRLQGLEQDRAKPPPGWSQRLHGLTDPDDNFHCGMNITTAWAIHDRSPIPRSKAVDSGLTTDSEEAQRLASELEAARSQADRLAHVLAGIANYPTDNIGELRRVAMANALRLSPKAPEAYEAEYLWSLYQPFGSDGELEGNLRSEIAALSKRAARNGQRWSVEAKLRRGAEAEVTRLTAALEKMKVSGPGEELGRGFVEAQRRLAMSLKHPHWCEYEGCDADGPWVCPDGTHRCEYHAADTAMADLPADERHTLATQYMAPTDLVEAACSDYKAAAADTTDDLLADQQPPTVRIAAIDEREVARLREELGEAKHLAWLAQRDKAVLRATLARIAAAGEPEVERLRAKVKGVADLYTGALRQILTLTGDEGGAEGEWSIEDVVGSVRELAREVKRLAGALADSEAEASDSNRQRDEARRIATNQRADLVDLSPDHPWDELPWTPSMETP